MLKWRSSDVPNKQVIHEYKPFCLGLLYEDEEIVREVTSILRKNIQLWAMQNSPIYKNFSEIKSKSDLTDKSSWYVNSVLSESQSMATSGSTTGLPFSYLRWDPLLYFIEATNHYDLIMDEFEIKENPNVLYFFNTSRYEKDKAITVRSDSDNFMEHHGIKRKATTHYVNFKMFQDQKKEFFNGFFDHVLKNEIDVIFSPGPSINSMCHYIREQKFKSKVCHLLSNSNEKIMSEDAAFLFEGHVDDICDHMRCWDGGASFFTCRHRNYHLMDNLSWCEDVEEKLVSTDYFNLPSPFVRYWNGDFCRITDTYQRCECGRLYREFEFLENRPFSLKGRSILDVKEALDHLRISNIKQVRCSAEFVEIVSYSPLRDVDKQFLDRKFPFKFRFVVEK